MSEKNLAEYRKDIERLVTYIPWLEKKAGGEVSRIYDGDGISGSTISFPVYDSTLLSFVNEASASGLMDKNYLYLYTRRGIRTVEDELKAIEGAELTDGDVLCGILSKYVLGGMTKGVVWSQAVKDGVFLAVLKKMKVLMELWDAPLA